MSFSSSFLLILLSIICCANGQFYQCDYVVNIPSVGQSIAINYPGANPAGRPCRYQVIAPVNSMIEASCSFTLQITSPCTAQQFLVSRSGDKQLRDASVYCGRGSILQRSIGNEIFIAFNTAVKNSATFQCVFKSIAINNSNCDCGWNVRSRIVGGSEAAVNEFVSHVGLVDRGTRSVFCGGSILTQNWILTAAHCFDAFPNTATTAVLAGDHDLSSGADTIWAAAYALESYIKHRQYNSDTNANDIALAKVRSYIRFNRGVGPACMPYTYLRNDAFFDGKSLTVVGWGDTEYGGVSSNVLKKAKLLVVSQNTCASMNKGIDGSKICTSESKAGSSCTKDSGGGLYFVPSRQFLIALVSYGTFCASKIPSVNTRITSYIGWIEDNVQTFMCRKT